jgi:1-acyl-sn-glycerol-3-phosphate acyltransferase
MVRALIKVIGSLFLFFLYLAASLAALTLPVKARTRQHWRTGLVSFFAGLVLRLYGVRVAAAGGGKLARPQGGHLVVANHLSYVDVLVIASLAPVVFVTSVELRNTLLLGQLARLSGSLFVERRKASGLKRDRRHHRRAQRRIFGRASRARRSTATRSSRYSRLTRR